jgi:hypothetical protein
MLRFNHTLLPTLYLRYLMLAVLIGIAGCDIVGRWAGSDLSPEMARDQFKLLRPESKLGKFVSADFRFQQDGSYTADIVYDGKLESHQGTYDYDANKGMVTIRDKEGNSYAFAAKKVDDQTLQFIKGIKGTDVTLTLKKRQ